MSKRRITYGPHPGVTAETEVDALARIFRFVLFESSAKGGAERSGQDDMKEVQDDRTNYR